MKRRSFLHGLLGAATLPLLDKAAAATEESKILSLEPKESPLLDIATTVEPIDRASDPYDIIDVQADDWVQVTFANGTYGFIPSNETRMVHSYRNRDSIGLKAFEAPQNRYRLKK